MMNEQTLELWQVDANGKIFDTNFAELVVWIGEGSLLRQDKVRKGNLRWIEAGKVPALIAVFNAKDNGEPLPGPVVTTTTLDPTAIPFDPAANPTNPLPSQVTAEYRVPTDPVSVVEPVCTIHPDVDAAYVCDTCMSQFCRVCPKSYGGTVKICPMCGAMCSSIAAIQAASVAAQRAPGFAGDFGFSDFVNALSYPFKFKASLIFGALLYMFFTLGQSVGGFGGMYMMVGAIVSFMLANTLTFGVLSHTVENFSQGKIGGNFMPDFDGFSIWDDVVHPFFLSIGVYISSFGPLIAVCLITFFMVMGAVKNEIGPDISDGNTVSKNAGNGSDEMNGLQSDAARSVDPGLPYAARAARQSEEIKALLNKQKEAQQTRVSAIEKGLNEADDEAEMPPLKTPNQPPTLGGLNPQNHPAAPPAVKDPDDEEFERLNNLIQQHRKAELESVVGKAPDTKAKEQAELLKQILGYGALFLLVAGICLLWGIFYFPAACAVAGYTASFAATVNPTVGLDTIRRLGFDYVKILLMGLALVVMSAFISGFIGVILSAFDMPGVGNVPAKAIGSLFGFYFSVVFSCILGFALYKGAERLKLFT